MWLVKMIMYFCSVFPTTTCILLILLSLITSRAGLLKEIVTRFSAAEFWWKYDHSTLNCAFWYMIMKPGKRHFQLLHYGEIAKVAGKDEIHIIQYRFYFYFNCNLFSVSLQDFVTHSRYVQLNDDYNYTPDLMIVKSLEPSKSNGTASIPYITIDRSFHVY